MARPFKKNPGAPDVDAYFDTGLDSEPALNTWFVDQRPESQPAPVNAPGLQGGGDEPAKARDTGSMPADTVPSQAAVASTPGADAFDLNTGTGDPAVAPIPTVVEISDYSAAQGDVIDFSATLRGSYAPLFPNSAQLRVAEDPSGAFATLDFNAGTAQEPHWTALAKLGGVQLGDPVNIVLDATHSIQLQSAWLA